MKSKNRYEGIDHFTIKTVRSKARDLIKNQYFPAYEHEDIEQELMTYLLTRLPLKDITGEQLKAGIIKKLVDEKAAQLIRDISSKKHHCTFAISSLYEPVRSNEGGNESILMDSIPNTASFLGEEHYCNDIDCKIDIDRTIENMPPALGKIGNEELCDLLKQMTVRDINRLTGISTNRIYKHLSRIRKAFLENNLKNYA